MGAVQVRTEVGNTTVSKADRPFTCLVDVIINLLVGRPVVGTAPSSVLTRDVDVALGSIEAKETLG